MESVCNPPLNWQPLAVSLPHDLNQASLKNIAIALCSQPENIFTALGR